MMNFWVDKGIGGFRMDVIDLIGKIPDEKMIGNGPKLHDYLQEMHQQVLKGKNLLTVGETGGVTPELAKLYSKPDREELSMVFQFEHIALDEVKGKSKWDLRPLELRDLKENLSKWQMRLHLEGWNSLFWNNHDQPRIVSRWGTDGKYRVKSAKMLATLLHGMQGTPYIYQGEEIGMTNVKWENIEDYDDIETHNMYKERISQGYKHEEIMKSIYVKGRDNSRTPIQWDDSENGGFTTGTTWLKVNENFKEINVKQSLKDEDSIFYHYQKLIQIRKSHDVIVYGDYHLLSEEDPDIFAYERTLGEDKILVVCNFYDQHVTFNYPHNYQDVGILLSNEDKSSVDLNSLILRPYEAVMYKFK